MKLYVEVISGARPNREQSAVNRLRIHADYDDHRQKGVYLNCTPVEDKGDGVESFILFDYPLGRWLLAAMPSNRKNPKIVKQETERARREVSMRIGQCWGLIEEYCKANNLAIQPEKDEAVA